MESGEKHAETETKTLADHDYESPLSVGDVKPADSALRRLNGSAETGEEERDDGVRVCDDKGGAGLGFVVMEDNGDGDGLRRELESGGDGDIRSLFGEVGDEIENDGEAKKVDEVIGEGNSGDPEKGLDQEMKVQEKEWGEGDDNKAKEDNEQHSDEQMDSEGKVLEKERSEVDDHDDEDEEVPVKENNGSNKRVASSSKSRGRDRIGKKKEIEELNVAENTGEADPVMQFSVGDFVWGKIKHQPWWPGRIYDSLSASDYALSLKRDQGQVLVAYFGDFSFAWCSPDQLIPFAENFEELRRKSSFKDFVNAVDAALDEFGRLIELEMACPCVSKSNERSRQLVINAGIIEGTYMQVGGLDKFSISQVQPAEVLGNLRHIASSLSGPKSLHVTLLTKLLPAFSRSRGCYPLHVYYEAEGMVDLGDKIEVQIGDTVLGPFEEDGISSPGGNENEPGAARSYVSKRRKQKRIAEILGTKTDTPESIGEDPDRGKGASGNDTLLVRKRRKISQNDISPSDDILLSQIQSKIAKKRQRRSPVATENTPSTMKQDNIVENNENSTLAKENLRTTSPGFESDLVADGTNWFSTSPRERKKSKYLSPPYTSLQPARVGGSRKGSQAAGLEFSDTAKMGLRMAKTASEMTTPTLKFDGPIEVAVVNDKSPPPAPQTSKGEDPSSNNPESSDRFATPTVVLSEIRAAAADPVSPRTVESFDTIKSFLSSYRRATYVHGVNDIVGSLEKATIGSRKRKGSEHKHEIESTTTNGEARPEKKMMELGSKNKTDLAGATSTSAVLLLSFPLEFALPSKHDLTQIYSKFGELDKSKTKVLKKSSSAKVFFKKGSDADEAHSCSQKNSPFGDAKVVYKLKRVKPKSETKKADVNTKPSEHKLKAKSSVEPVVPSADNAEASGLAYVKQKLQEMTSLFEETGSRMSQETKTNLMIEMKKLLRKLKE
ncbi:PWWP domain-containing protein [Drosera capensis]